MFARYPSCSATFSIRSRVEGATRGEPWSALDTVAMDVPATIAMSSRVTRRAVRPSCGSGDASTPVAVADGFALFVILSVYSRSRGLSHA